MAVIVNWDGQKCCFQCAVEVSVIFFQWKMHIGCCEGHFTYDHSPSACLQSTIWKMYLFFQHPHYQKEKAAGLNVLTIHLFMVKSLHYSDHRINAKTLWSSTCEWRSELHGHSWSVICVSIILRSTEQIKEIKGKKKTPFRQAEWLELILEA